MQRFYEKLRREGVDVTLTVGRGMNHDFPILPVPEALLAQRKITPLVLADKSENAVPVLGRRKIQRLIRKQRK